MDSKDAPQIIEYINQSVDFTPYECRWVPCSAKFVCLGGNANGTGAFRIYELGNNKLEKIVASDKKSSFKCGTFGASLFEQRHLATGNYDGQLQIWDLEKLEVPVYSVQAHNTLVNCIDGIGGLNIGFGAPEIVTAARDGKVKIWDPRQTEQVASLEPAAGQTPRDCWAVAFGNSYENKNATDSAERIVAAGYDNGDIKLLDLRMNRLLWECNVGNGVVGLDFDRKDIQMNKMVVTTLESKFRIFNLRVQHPTEGFSSLTEKAHKSTVWLAKHVPQNRDLFITCGGNGTLNMYHYTYPKQLVKKDEDGHDTGVMGNVKILNSKEVSKQPIVSFDWHTDKLGLCCLCSLDTSVKVGIVTKLNQY